MRSCTPRLVCLGLEQERTVDDDRLTGLQTGEHFHFTAEIAAAPDSPNLECGRVLRHEHDPFVLETLQRSSRYGHERLARLAHGDGSRRRHSRPEDAILVGDLDANGHSPGLCIHLAADVRHAAGEGTSWHCSETHLCL